MPSYPLGMVGESVEDDYEDWIDEDSDADDDDYDIDEAMDDLDEAIRLGADDREDGEDDDDDDDDDEGEEEEEEDEEGDGTVTLEVQEGDDDSGNVDGASALRALIARLTGSGGSQTGPIVLPPGALRALLDSGTLRTTGGVSGRGLRRRIDEDEDDDDDEYRPIPGAFDPRDPSNPAGRTRKRHKGFNWFPLRTRPVPEALELARGGEFGRVGFPPIDMRMPPASRLPASPSSSPERTSETPAKYRGTERPRTAGNLDIDGTTYHDIEGEGEEHTRVDPQSIQGIKWRVQGRGAWAAGRSGWKREVGRGVWGGSGREEWARHCVPNSNGTIVATYNSSPYIGKHSHDCSFFYTATQAFQLHMYSTEETREPPARSAAGAAGARRRMNRGGRAWLGGWDEDYDHEDCSLRKIKTVQGVEGRWTVTDADLSRDNEWMIYSSITSKVHLLRTAEHEDEHTQLNFAAGSNTGRWGEDHFGIWSIRFSADQSEIVAGAGSGQIMVYDIENRRRTLCVNAHEEDVNGVCFADESSTNVIVSASDDGYLKVWDRRSLASETPSGVLVGHTEGITYVAPKGDGRYCISNGKDQAIRLWDLRQMRRPDEVRDRDATISYGLRGWDYRNGTYRKPRFLAHPKDCSVMTYRGMRTLRTLIRCNFSPTSTTGGSYIYTGGANGVIYVFALDGRIVQVMDRNKATPIRRPDGTYNDPSAPLPLDEVQFDPDPLGNINCTVRDVSWSSVEPSLISTAWENSYSRGGNVAVHHWRGLGKGGLNTLEDWVEKSASNSLEDGAA